MPGAAEPAGSLELSQLVEHQVGGAARGGAGSRGVTQIRLKLPPLDHRPMSCRSLRTPG